MLSIWQVRHLYNKVIKLSIKVNYICLLWKWNVWRCDMGEGKQIQKPFLFPHSTDQQITCHMAIQGRLFQRKTPENDKVCSQDVQFYVPICLEITVVPSKPVLALSSYQYALWLAVGTFAKICRAKNDSFLVLFYSDVSVIILIIIKHLLSTVSCKVLKKKLFLYSQYF